MLNKIGTPGHETISTPNPNATAVIEALRAAGIPDPVVAEIGVGIGATSLALATCLDNHGTLHLYDFAELTAELTDDLAQLGFTNVQGFGNSDRHWDSYNWTLARRVLQGEHAIYDYMYLDGAHTFAVDALAFVLADRLLKPGGYLEFGNYRWTFAASRWMQNTRQQFMTEEQIRTPQVKMVLDLFLRGNPDYEALQPNRLYRKSCTVVTRPVSQPSGSLETIRWRGQAFQVVAHAAVAAALREFRSPFEAGTLEFFDAVLPDCNRMIDVGAHVGLMSLYVAGRVQDVFSFEPSPASFALLSRNVAANVALQARVRLFPCGLSDTDGSTLLYRKAAHDSGSSIFRTVERHGMVSGVPEATIALRNAHDALGEIGLTGRTLLKIDIEGAEYLVLPQIADLLAEAKPFLHVSFHPFNLVSGDGDYVDALMRIRRAVEVAEALSAYDYMYCYEQGQWRCIETADRLEFLHGYLLRAKPVPRIGSAQYGFIDAIGFADRRLPALDAAGAAVDMQAV